MRIEQIIEFKLRGFGLHVLITLHVPKSLHVLLQLVIFMIYC